MGECPHCLVRPCCFGSSAQLVIINASLLYFNPSEDDCPAYTQKRLFAFTQVWIGVGA
jgi:hypothetical protein